MVFTSLSKKKQLFILKNKKVKLITVPKTSFLEEPNLQKFLNGHPKFFKFWKDQNQIDFFGK